MSPVQLQIGSAWGIRANRTQNYMYDQLMEKIINISKFSVDFFLVAGYMQIHSLKFVAHTPA